MPMRVDVERLPKACEEFKKMIGDVTKESVSAASSAEARQARGKAMTAMRNQLRNNMPEKFQEYKGLANDKDRMDWLAEYIINPEEGGSVGTNFTRRTKARTDRDSEVWITEEQMSGPTFLNSKDHAAIAAKSLPCRLHENVALAAVGVKQYQWTWTIVSRDLTLEQGAEVTTTAEMTPAEAAAVRDHMQDERNPGHQPPPTTRRCTKKNSAKPLSPDKQKLSDVKDAVKKAIDLMKTNHDKIHRELTSVKAIESKMRSKAWDTSGPIEYLNKETMKIQSCNDDLLAAWLAAKMYFETVLDSTSVTELGSKADEYEKQAIQVMACYKKFSAEVLKEFKRST